MRWAAAAALAAVSCGAWPARASAAVKIKHVLVCPTVELVGPYPPDLSNVEKSLACGTPGRPGWTNIPVSQAEYFLRAFVQKRGFYRPAFSQGPDGRLIVTLGPRGKIQKLTANGLPPFVRLYKRRKTIGQVLTPAELDRYQQWITTVLQENGYACPKVDVTADADTGELHAEVNPGPRTIFPQVKEDVPAAVDPRIFFRYQAFQVGWPFDQRLYTLTTDRITADGLFLSAYYDLVCSTAGALGVTHRVLDAPPRQVTLGAGIDTEGIVRFRAEWKNSRLGPSADSLLGQLYLSTLEQQALGQAKIYPTPGSLVALTPQASFSRLSEPRFEVVQTEGMVLPSVGWEAHWASFGVRTGPAIDWVRTISGGGPSTDQYVSLQTQLNLLGHLYEYYRDEPQAGVSAGLSDTTRVKGADSDITANVLRLAGSAYINVGELDPPAFIIGWRGVAESVAVASRDRPLLPVTQRFFLGGSTDMEGFSLQQLPTYSNGFLTAIYQGIEMRAGDVFPLHLEPLLIFDAAMGGVRQFDLDPNIYFSPGFGLRWPSPVGSLRLTLARAYTFDNPAGTAPPPYWQFYFSFGQNF